MATAWGDSWGVSWGHSWDIITSAVDTHDGVFDERKYRKLQERLRRQREQLETQDDQRKGKLRKELLRLYRGLPEDQIERAKEQLALKQPEAKAESRQSDNIDNILPVLESMSANIANAQASLIQEYRGILARESLRQEAEEEDELETIITAVL